MNQEKYISLLLWSLWCWSTLMPLYLWIPLTWRWMNWLSTGLIQFSALLTSIARWDLSLCPLTQRHRLRWHLNWELLKGNSLQAVLSEMSLPGVEVPIEKLLPKLLGRLGKENPSKRLCTGNGGNSQITNTDDKTSCNHTCRDTP